MTRSFCGFLPNKQLLAMDWVVTFSVQLVGHFWVQINSEIEISQPRPVPGQFAAKTGPLEVKSVETARWDRAKNAAELMSFRVDLFRFAPHSPYGS
jgi:hypothetical protein